ncbi:hypothetical protein N7465_007983 [Penicillium sp. CMV-2018d]|nr:hypothetical protein N7465_007983 [Penicillium sp. CMV-2018d]
MSLLLKYPNITESEDQRLVYHHRGTKVHIDLEVMGAAAWAPNPRTTRVHTVAPADCPRRRLNSMGALSCSTNLESSLILDYSPHSPPVRSSVNEASAPERGRSGDASCPAYEGTDRPYGHPYDPDPTMACGQEGPDRFLWAA